jgi:hypothetical protein
MRSLSIVVLVLGVAVAAVRADDNALTDSSPTSDADSAPKSQTTTKSSWLTPRDTWGGHKPTKKQAAAADEKEKAKAEAAKAAALNADKARAREEANLLRRLAVCDQLRLIASKTNDDTLARHADELDQRARDVYAQRIARLPVHMVVSKSDVEKAKQQRDKP